jgi:hypothetical protein
MNPIAVTAIQAIVAPVVLITTAAILSGALLTIYGSVNDACVPWTMNAWRS